MKRLTEVNHMPHAKYVVKGLCQDQGSDIMQSLMLKQMNDKKN